MNIPAKTMNDDSFITLDEIAELIFGGKITAWTLKAEIRRGNLKAFKLGRRYFTTPAYARDLAQCLSVESRPDFTFTRKGRSGISETEKISAAQAALRSRFEKPSRSSRNIPAKNTGRKQPETH
jgi:hypothetical protein